MSFSGTPLGQGRRLDHNTFLGKPPSTSNRPPSPHRIIPTSYAYGAPTLGSRSPPKPSSPVHERNTSSIANNSNDDDQDEPALARFARLKQREQASRPSGSNSFVSQTKPEKWTVKDTSVNIAAAFNQAASDMTSTSNPNNSWASGSSRPNQAIPRSTSVEYEKETQSTATRRLAPPPNRFGAPRTTVAPRVTQASRAAAPPLSRSASVRHVPDSEGEEEHVDQNGRGKSPFEDILGAAKHAMKTTSFYLRQFSQEPEQPLAEQPPTNGKDSSYDYAAEEQEFQETNLQPPPRRSTAAHKRGRISTDNKAYKPSVSDVESSDGDTDDDGKSKRRKKKKKKEPVGGPLTTLPVLSQDKRKKRRARGSKGGLGGAEEEEESESDEQSLEIQAPQMRASVSRNSAPPTRLSVPPPDNDVDTSIDDRQGLDSIPEIDEMDIEADNNRSLPPHHSTPFSIGGFLGTIVNRIFSYGRSLGLTILQFLTMLLFAFGRITGIMMDVIFNRPTRWLLRAKPGPAVSLAKYLILGATILLAWYALQDRLTKWIPRLPSQPTYVAPEVPAANIAELSARLQRIENALSGLSLDAERSRVKADTDTRSHVELIGRLGALESRVQMESRRAVEAELEYKNAASQGLKGVKQDMEMLQSQMQVQQRQQQAASKKGGSASDEEARAKLLALEERVGSVEGGVKEALEVGKKAVGSAPSAANAAWWNKLASGSASKTGLTIKSSDGQDVSALIGHLVDSAVTAFGKDGLARPDFALHSGGARVIPSLTSATFEMRPPSLRSQLIGLVTGNGYAIGRPPITALHHELHNGHCWPFAGTEGQLGVALAAPTYISDITIDHVAKEVAFDMRSAPRQMEVWGMVEGGDNVAKVKEWMAEKQRRRDEAKEAGEIVEDEEEDYPKTLPKSPPYIRIASFSYNIHAPNNVQTFPVSQEIQDLGIDFGIVVLRIASNWGREEFTCLYRMRVHGQRMGETPLPYPEELA